MTEYQRDQLILGHLALVKSVAIGIRRNIRAHVDMDDLIHSGVIGLIDAVTKYDAKTNVPFASYANYRIRGAILDSLRELDWASRDIRRRHKQLEAAIRELTAALEREPMEAEIADKMDMPLDRWRTMMLDLRTVGLLSASTRPLRYEDDLPSPDFACRPDSYPDAICMNKQLRSVLTESLRVLSPRYRKVITLYYSSEMSMKQIGAELGVTESRVSSIHKASMEKLRQSLLGSKLTFAALS